MTARLTQITLTDSGDSAPAPEVEQERRVAIFDLLEANHFALLNGPDGPYSLRLGLTGSTLGFELAAADGVPAGDFTVTLGETRQVVKDYAQICANYYDAVRTQPPFEIELLDEARRAIHVEGAQSLRTILAAHVAIDEDTARRLFTLVCALDTGV